MNARWLRVDAPAATPAVRLGAGAVFFLDGIQFIFPAYRGVGRCSRVSSSW
jgi:hypothetical protein